MHYECSCRLVAWLDLCVGSFIHSLTLEQQQYKKKKPLRCYLPCAPFPCTIFAVLSLCRCFCLSIASPSSVMHTVPLLCC